MRRAEKATKVCQQEQTAQETGGLPHAILRRDDGRLLGRRAPTSADTSTAASTEAAAVTVWRTSTTRTADRPLSTLLPSLNRDPSDGAITTVDTNPTLTASDGGQRRDDSAFGGIQTGELEEGASLGADDFELLDGTKALRKDLVELGVADGFDYSLYLAVSDVA
jgi:hypothetical protein